MSSSSGNKKLNFVDEWSVEREWRTLEGHNQWDQVGRLFVQDGDIYNNLINLPKTNEKLPERAQNVTKYYLKPPKIAKDK